MKKIVLIVALALSSLITVSPNALAAVADCVAIGTPSVSNTSTSIVMQVSITANCSSSQLGSNGGTPRYSILEENSNTYSCSGPENLTSGRTSSIRCSIAIGSISGSVRTGATSSTLRVSFRTDSSFKLVPFNHIAITSSACVNAPQQPRLIVTYPDTTSGPRFEFGPSSGGDIANQIFWSYMTFDISRNQWDPWSIATTEKLDEKGNGSFVFQSLLNPTKSKIAFYAYSSNECGKSLFVRENQDSSGIPLAGRVENNVTLKLSTIGIMDSINLADLFSLASNSNFSVISASSALCNVVNGKLVPAALGNCILSISAEAYYNISALYNFRLTVPVVKNNQTLKNQSFIATQMGNNIAYPISTDQGLAIVPEITTNAICALDGNSLIALSPGNCIGVLRNTGSEKFNPFALDFKVDVLKQNQKISVSNLASGVLVRNRSIKLNVSASSNLPVSANNLTPQVCKYSSGNIQIFANGVCNFELIQLGDATFAPAPKVTIKMTISNQSLKTAIICTKGSISKTVVGTKPTCPAGFKRA